MTRNPAKAYFEAMYLAAFGVKLFNGMVAEWQIDAIKECSSKMKEVEIDHLSISESEKLAMKHQWKTWLDATTDGFKEELRRNGRMI